MFGRVMDDLAAYPMDVYDPDDAAGPGQGQNIPRTPPPGEVFADGSGVAPDNAVAAANDTPLSTPAAGAGNGNGGQVAAPAAAAEDDAWVGGEEEEEEEEAW